MAQSRKCSRGKKYKRSYKRSNGTKVKGHCYSPKKNSRKGSRKVSRKVSHKRSPRRACPSGMTWRKSHVRSSGKKVKGRCVNTKASRFFVNLTPSAPYLVQEPKAFIASSLLPEKRDDETEMPMPALETFGFGGCGAMY